jgi:Na+/proline symporter
MAFSFFLMWSLMGAGQPSGMVRLMSFKDSASLRRALLLIAGYYVLTYMALLVIFVCARAIYPTQYLGGGGDETKGEPDSIMPAMTRYLADSVGMPWVAGLLLAAPYAAIMSTVAAFLLMLSSSLVRDIYQRIINPHVSDRTIKVVSYLVTGVVGILVLLGAMNPPRYLQYLIVFTGSGQGCAFLIPMGMALYWRRATRQGMLAGMLGGFGALFGLYVLGWLDSACQGAAGKALIAAQAALTGAGTQATLLGEAPIALPAWASWLNTLLGWLPGWGVDRGSAVLPLYVGGVDPLVWGLVASGLFGIAVSLLTQPDEELLNKYYPPEAPSLPQPPQGEALPG